MRQLGFDAVETTQELGFKPSLYRELSIDGGYLDGDSHVLPILSQLSHRMDKRWLTCVNTPELPRDVAKAADIQPRQLLKVKSSHRIDETEVIKKALRSGQSHTVIGFCGDLTIEQREDLKRCAELSDCQCLVLTRT
ncbi:MAG: cell division inhibitor SulA [Halioglobus sp.]|jgi:cell division inhibitor SulA